MTLQRRIRARFDQWRMDRVIRRLNAHAVFFGYPRATREQWIAGCEKLARAARQCGVNAMDAAGALKAAVSMGAAQPDPMIEVGKAWIAAERQASRETGDNDGNSLVR